MDFTTARAAIRKLRANANHSHSNLGAALEEVRQACHATGLYLFCQHENRVQALGAGANSSQEQCQAVWAHLQAASADAHLEALGFWVPEAGVLPPETGPAIVLRLPVGQAWYAVLSGQDAGFPWRLSKPNYRQAVQDILSASIRSYVGRLHSSALQQQHAHIHAAKAAEMPAESVQTRAPNQHNPSEATATGGPEATRDTNETAEALAPQMAAEGPEAETGELPAQPTMFPTAGGQAHLGLLLQALGHITDGILITDAELNKPGPTIMFVNPAFCKMTGYSAQEMLGRAPRFLQGPLTNRKVLDDIRRGLERGSRVTATTYNYRKDGTPFMLEWTMSPIKEAGEKPRYWIASQRDITNRVLEQQRQLDVERELTERVTEAQESERRRIAQDLHDSLGQQLSLLRLQNSEALRQLTSATTTADLAALCAQLEVIQTSIDAAVEQMREIARNLAPRVLGRAGLFVGMRQLCSQVALSSGLAVTCDFDGDDRLMGQAQTVVVYRILQELLNNTLKHARASRIDIRAVIRTEGMEMRFSDNGIGIPPGAMQSGMGLQNIWARTQLMQGDVQIRNEPGCGTKFNFTFPNLLRINGL